MGTICRFIHLFNNGYIVRIENMLWQQCFTLAALSNTIYMLWNGLAINVDFLMDLPFEITKLCIIWWFKVEELLWRWFPQKEWRFEITIYQSFLRLSVVHYLLYIRNVQTFLMLVKSQLLLMFIVQSWRCCNIESHHMGTKRLSFGCRLAALSTLAFNSRRWQITIWFFRNLFIWSRQLLAVMLNPFTRNDRLK